MPKKISSKTDWITLGYSLFAKEGHKGIIVERMAKKLKCNKSSFYHYFQSKPKFITEIIAYWIQIDTDDIIQITNSFNSPQEQFDAFLKTAFKFDPNIDFNFHLRLYAKRDSLIAQLVQKTDEHRKAFLQELLIALNPEQDKSSEKAEIFYRYFIGYHVENSNQSQSPNYVEEVRKDLQLMRIIE